MTKEFNINFLKQIAPSVEDRLVAVEINANSEAEIFIRNPDSSLTIKKEDFFPFLLLQDRALLSKLPNSELTELESLKLNCREFRCLAKFASVEDYEKALEHLKKSSGFSPSSPYAPYKVFNDFCLQFLIQKRIRLFSGMTFREIRRLQFDIETLLTNGYDFPNPDREGDKIAIICMRDSTGWEKTLILDENKGGEKRLIKEFVDAIIERDPDVIEGYNIFRFDLPFIEKRAKRYGVELKIGRDGSKLKSRLSRVSFAERNINYTRFDTYGRHIVDVYFMVQFYDISHRDLEDFNLKSVARHLNVQVENRTYVEHENISEIFKKDPAKLAAYCRDDVRETNSISEILSPSYFYQTQIIPLSYQNSVVRGNATKIDIILTAEYLNSRTAIPYPEEPRTFEGALTSAFESGIFENVWHCDIRSLYPSILIAGNKNPARDSLGSFLKILKTLRKFRLLAKDASREEKDREKREFYDAIQSTFKILINSFYGYLGFAQGAFNDYALAAAVTAAGREILSSMTDFLCKSGAKVIEIDTDGIYFQPPASEKNPEIMEKKIQAILPAGIDVELDNVYKAMFCYKSKNYALLHENGEVSITGAALKSRGLEPFQREYMSELIEKLLKKDFKGISELNEKCREMIKKRLYPLAKLAKTETLQDSLETYSRKIQSGEGRRSAAYELALKSERGYKQGDQVSYYITGTKKKVSAVDNCRLLHDAPEIRNENIDYYLAKFEELEKKFSVFIPDEYKTIKRNDDFFS